MAPRSRANAADTDASMSDAQEHRQGEEMVSYFIRYIHSLFTMKEPKANQTS